MKSEESPLPENRPVRRERVISWRLLCIIVVAAMFTVAVGISTTLEVINHRKQAQEITELNQKMTEQDQRIKEMQDQLAKLARLSDGYLYERLRQFEENATTSILELEEYGQRQAEELRGAKNRTSELEDEVRQLQGSIDTLQTSKAGQSELDHLSNTVSVISHTKVNRTEFNSLSSDVSDLRETVSTKANKDVVLDLTKDVHALEATALNESHYHKLQGALDVLKRSKVDQTDFEDLVSNVTSLADSTVRTKDFLQLSEELNVTRETLTNTRETLKSVQHDLTHTQEDLCDARIRISELRTDFEYLAANVTSLADNTVKTSEFLQLYETVDNLEFTTQENVSLLELNFANQISFINTTLTTKADKHDVDLLAERVSTTTVTLTAFEVLEDTVQSLTTSKADQTSLIQLETRVNTLNETTAKQQDLDSLNGKVSNHTSSSQQTHEQHDSRISGNADNIESINTRIKSVENDIEQLKNSGLGLTASWIVVIASTALFLVMH